MQKILVVDDNAEIQKLMKLILGLQYKVFAADSASDAAIKLSEVKPDLILLDIMMPGLNGLDWCRLIRKWSQYNHVKIIMVSALDQSNDIAEGLESGANGYISKPFSPMELLDEVARQLTN